MISLQKIKALPKETNLYFGHEYTLRNIGFVEEQGDQNEFLSVHKRESEKKQAAGQPTTPGTLATEMRINPFLLATSIDEFRTWRKARDSY